MPVQRLPGDGKRAARKTSGLEAALIDNESVTIEALEPEDRRSARLRVAGVAALLVAKTHKIVDGVKTGREDRLADQDGDMSAPNRGELPGGGGIPDRQRLLGKPVAAPRRPSSVEHFEELFGRRAGAGIELASGALREAMPAEGCVRSASPTPESSTRPWVTLASG